MQPPGAELHGVVAGDDPAIAAAEHERQVRRRPAPDGRLYGIDHGVSFHVDDKLRTLLWGWAGEELPAEAAGVLDALDRSLAPGAPLAARLAELLTDAEVVAVRTRVEALRATGRHPEPSGRWPAIPWPPEIGRASCRERVL